MRWVRGNFVRDPARGGYQFVGCNHFGNEADAQRFCRVDHFTGQRQFGSLGKSDNARQQPSSAIARYNPELNEALRKFGVVGCHTDIAHTRKVAACANGVTVDGSHNGHFECLK